MTAAFGTIGDVLRKFADYPPDRIRLDPRPGTATKADVLVAETRDGTLCELIDGVLVEKTVGLKESFVAKRIVMRLGNFVEQGQLGDVAGPDGTVELFPGRVRIPDVAFFGRDKLAAAAAAVEAEAIPELVPDLAVEVLSRSNTRTEMFAKLKDYFFAGVKLVWYVDPRSRTVEVFTGVDAGTTLTATDTLTGGAVLPGFAVPVADLFG